MPVILKKDFAKGWLALWHIGESAVDLMSLVSGADTEKSREFTSDKRRRQWLAWRALLRTYIPDAVVQYNDRGAPCIGGRYIGVSHSGDYAAVIFSENGPCAVDMENRKRDFSRAAPRFISPWESSLPGSSDSLFPAVVWCAKETLYKLAGRKELDLLEDIRITSCDIATGSVTGSYPGCTGVKMEIMLYGDMVVVYHIA